MERWKGLENDITYLDYVDTRERIINILNDDNSHIDTMYISVLVDILSNTRRTLDKIKEYRDGRETENSDTETGRSNDTSDC